jgi:hypothetical protein
MTWIRLLGLRWGLLAVLAVLEAGVVQEASAQRDSTRADSVARAKAKADSIARADSLALIKELEKAAAPEKPSGAQQQTQGPTNPRLLPDISAVGDFVADLSKGGSTQEDGTRIGVREVEIQILAAVDPYFRGEILASWSDTEGATLEQAILTATAMPWGLQARIGRVPVPFGKQNITHREALHTIEFPYAIQRFLSPEGLKANSVVLSGIWSPFGFFQEVLLSVMDRFGEAPEGLVAEEPSNKDLKGLGYGLRLRNYWDLTQNANLEVSGSVATGLREQPLDVTTEINAVLARQTLLGADVTYRWRPLQQGLYRSLIVQAEYFRQFNESDPPLPSGITPEQYLGPTRAFDGAYLLGRYQVTRRTFVLTRGDLLEDPDQGGQTLGAVSGYVQFLPSEFSKLVAGYEWLMPEASDHHGRLLLQATFTIGPHRPHPF